MKTAAKVFIIIGMVIQCFFIYPIIVGCFALKKMDTATSRRDLRTMAILTLIFCSTLGGVFMLLIEDDEIKSENSTVKSAVPNIIYKNVTKREGREVKVIFDKKLKTVVIMLSVLVFLCSVIIFGISFAHLEEFNYNLWNYYKVPYRTSTRWSVYATVIIIFSSLVVALSIWQLFTSITNSVKLYKANIVMLILAALSVLVVIVMMVTNLVEINKYPTYASEGYAMGFGAAILAMSIAVFAVLPLFIIFYVMNREFNTKIKIITTTEVIEVNVIEEELNQIKQLLDKGTISEVEYTDLRSGILAKYKKA